MNDKPTQSFLSQVSATFVARLALVANSVLAGALLARLLGAEGVGVYAVLTLTVNTLVQIMGSGLASANVYFTKRQEASSASILINSIAFAGVAGIIATILTYGLSLLRPDWFHGIPPGFVFVALVSLPFQLCTLLGLNLVIALGEVKKFNLLDVVSQAYLLVNTVIVLLLIHSDLYLLLVFNTVSSILMAIVLIWMVRRMILSADSRSRFSLDPSLLGRMMRFGVKINLMNASLAVILRADVLLVNYFRGQTEAGVYSIAAQCSLLLIMFPNVVGTMLFPNIAGMGTGSSTFTSRVIRHTAVIQLCLCFAAIPVSFLLPYIYGNGFAPATFQFLLLLPGAFFLGLQMMLSQHLVGVGRISVMPIFWVMTLILSIALNLLLIPAFGAMGAALVSSITYALIFVLTLSSFLKITGENWRDIFVIGSGEIKQLLGRFR